DSLLNGIIIVCVVCALTFFIVILYKYRCMKILLGYMILSSMLLLGFLCSIMFEVAIDRYELNVDVLSFYFFLYNFSVVGTVAIFFGKGIPPFVTQGYLIATSVIVAWQLAFFDAWTAWVLLVLLALYDLFAVLTPCGPLKALVNLMQQEDAPDMPGLLYEASGRNSIKLGLGDFIFYSILVSKAAIYSFATFAASSLAILAGLGLTLLLLAIRGQALPALPISIFLGVVFYLTTRYVLEPWVEELFLHQVYI
ncbi:predicted protein, partial [Phaeodactylum tricornutum CCAP 1055/1]